MTARDKGHVEEIIKHLKRVENDYGIDLTPEMEWLRGICKEEPVSEDLEEEIDRYWEKAHGSIEITDIARHFANWQKEKTLKESEDAIRYVKENHSPSEVSDFQNAMNISVMKAFDAGKEKMREQMMKDAIEVEVKIDAGGYPYIPQIELYDYDNEVFLACEGDKVKIIKED